MKEIASSPGDLQPFAKLGTNMTHGAKAQGSASARHRGRLAKDLHDAGRGAGSRNRAPSSYTGVPT